MSECVVSDQKSRRSENPTQLRTQAAQKPGNTYTIATCGTVDLNLASIRGKALGGVLRCDTALEGKASGGDVVLSQAELLEGGASGDLDLGGDDVDAGDFLGDGVLDLAVILLVIVHPRG